MTMTSTKKYEFLRIEDFGKTTCPHCGTDGRYIYTWKVNGEQQMAMSGCFKLLTKDITKPSLDKFLESMHLKISRRKPLNSWERSIQRLLSFREAGKYPKDWCDKKIEETLEKKRIWMSTKH